jgi:hypothetical protein
LKQLVGEKANTMKRTIVRLPALILLLGALPCVSQTRSAATTAPDSNAEVLAICSVVDSEPFTLTPYGFAKATVVSLWYAKTAAERGNEIKQASEGTDNIFSFITAMMRINKASTNDFYCAKRSLQQFAAKHPDENVRTAAAFMMVVYDAHVSINARMNELLKNLDQTDQGELMDGLSTLQVERGQRWADLVQPTTMALMMMVDLRRTDAPNRTTRLLITKAQKLSLLTWIDDHFPEFKNGTPKKQWSDPAKTAQLYFKVFEGRKCADE